MISSVGIGPLDKGKYEEIKRSGKKWAIISIISSLIVGGFFFYWYELRPVKIRKKCFETHNNEGRLVTRDYNNCIIKSGLGLDEIID